MIFKDPSVKKTKWYLLKVVTRCNNLKDHYLGTSF